jgi:hypothetical protein
LRSARGEVEGNLGSYCWKGYSDRPALCADAIPPSEQTELTVGQGQALELSFARSDSPSSIRATRFDQAGWRDGQEFQVPAANPSRFSANFEKGTRWLSFNSKWPEGEVTHYFKIQVA